MDTNRISWLSLGNARVGLNQLVPPSGTRPEFEPSPGAAKTEHIEVPVRFNALMPCRVEVAGSRLFDEERAFARLQSNLFRQRFWLNVNDDGMFALS
jgi:hypothetical protein